MKVSHLFNELLKWNPQFNVESWWDELGLHEKLWGSVLVQNTTWHNASLALEELRRNQIKDIRTFLQTPLERVESIIRPAGFYKSKSKALVELSRWYSQLPLENGSMDLTTARAQLLAMKGIGPETADCILLYVFHQRTIMGDTYTRRLLGRLNNQQKVTYDSVRQSILSEPFSLDELQIFHGLIVQFNQLVCTKLRPKCMGCPLRQECAYGLTHING